MAGNPLPRGWLKPLGKQEEIWTKLPRRVPTSHPFSPGWWSTVLCLSSANDGAVGRRQTAKGEAETGSGGGWRRGGDGGAPRGGDGEGGTGEGQLWRQEQTKTSVPWPGHSLLFNLFVFKTKDDASVVLASGFSEAAISASIKLIIKTEGLAWCL